MRVIAETYKRLHSGVIDQRERVVVVLAMVILMKQTSLDIFSLGREQVRVFSVLSSHAQQMLYGNTLFPAPCLYYHDLHKL